MTCTLLNIVFNDSIDKEVAWFIGWAEGVILCIIIDYIPETYNKK